MNPPNKSSPKTAKLPRRATMTNVIRRYLKKDSTPNWQREYPLFIKIWKNYPSEDFWLKHSLPFELNSMAWFLTIQGKRTLESDWAVFHYNPDNPSATLVYNNPLDIFPQHLYNTGIDRESKLPAPAARPKSVADFLS